MYRLDINSPFFSLRLLFCTNIVCAFIYHSRVQILLQAQMIKVVGFQLLKQRLSICGQLFLQQFTALEVATATLKDVLSFGVVKLSTIVATTNCKDSTGEIIFKKYL